ncbi:MAG: transposase [Thiobacillus sp.]|nr:transposase [Thiobacillus sp.]
MDKRKTKVVTNDLKGLKLLAEWLGKQGVALTEVHGVLEATGVYHEQAALWLVDAGVTVSVANPAQAKDFARGLAVRTKTDGVDSVVLARYGALVKPQPWQASPLEVRELNRQEKATVSGVPDLVQQSLDTHLAVLKQEIARLQTAIDDHIDHHPSLKADREYLLTIPAVGEKTANRMLAVLPSRTFRTAEQVAAFLGLVPVEHQSGSSVQKRPHLSKNGDARTRAVLHMAAVVATSYNPDIKALYDCLCARGKTKMVALGAAMRKLVHLCFGVLKHQQVYRQNVAVLA